MSISKLYISHVDADFKKIPGIFLNNKNLNKILHDNSYHVCKTSPVDLSFNNFANVIDSTQTFEIVDIDDTVFLNLSDIDFCTYGRFFVLLQESNKPITNFQFIENLFYERFAIIDKNRKTNNKTLWVAGCSITAGTGVNENERFGDILSKQYYVDYDYINIAKSASSIWFQANKILQADIQANDIVIWGITASNRIEYIEKDGVIKSISQGNDKFGVAKLEKSQQFWNEEYFYSKLLYLSNINLIISVINCCKKIGAKLILVNFLEMEIVPLAFKNLNIFLNITKNSGLIEKKFLDFGIDSIHPGPKQHLEYADKIHKFIQERYFK